MTTRHLRIGFVLSSIDRGGAERQLITLCSGLIERGHDVVIYVIRSGGVLEEEARRRGLRIVPLTRSGLTTILSPARLACMLKRHDIEVLHGYMVAGNILAAVAGILGRRPVVFGIRGLRAKPPTSAVGRFRSLTILYIVARWMERRMARRARTVITNSEEAAEDCRDRGFPADRIVVVHNGVDTSRFRPDPNTRTAMREAWGWNGDHIVVGRIARFADSKDYPTFLRAAELAGQADEQLRFVCVGDGVDGGVSELLHDFGPDTFPPDRILALPGRDDIEAVMTALDVHVLSSSSGDSFPNVVCEAMACGVPSVVTGVAASPMIVADTGHVVPIGQPEAMARAITELAVALRRNGDPLRAAARARISENFPVSRMVTSTEKILIGVA